MSHLTKDELWIYEHFSELVEKYPGKYIAVANGELVAVGDSRKEVEEIARKKYPSVTPSVLRVPKEEDLICAL